MLRISTTRNAHWVTVVGVEEKDYLGNKSETVSETAA
jgi:hypothetical protein